MGNNKKNKYSLHVENENPSPIFKCIILNTLNSGREKSSVYLSISDGHQKLGKQLAETYKIKEKYLGEEHIFVKYYPKSVVTFKEFIEDLCKSDTTIQGLKNLIIDYGTPAIEAQDAQSKVPLALEEKIEVRIFPFPRQDPEYYSVELYMNISKSFFKSIITKYG